MQASPDTTLGALFPKIDGERWREGIAALESSPSLGGLAGKIAGQTDLMNWPAMLKEIFAKVPDLLKVDVGSVLVGAWMKSEQLRRYADPEKYGPEETILVELARHKISSSHEPHLDILIGETSIGRIDFEFTVTLTLESAILKIRDGKIWTAQTGACQASGELKCEGHSLLKRESEPFALPGTLTLPEPIQIARPADRPDVPTGREASGREGV